MRGGENERGHTWVASLKSREYPRGNRLSRDCPGKRIIIRGGKIACSLLKSRKGRIKEIIEASTEEKGLEGLRMSQSLGG